MQSGPSSPFEPAGFACLAVVCAAAAWLADPARLLSLGILDGSLTHESALVRETTKLEIAAARWLLAVLAAAAGGLALAWPRIAAHPRYQRFLAAPLPEAPHGRGLATPGFWVMLALTVLAAALAAGGGAAFSQDQLYALGREDGVAETASALLLLAAAGAAAANALRLGPGRRGFGMQLFLAVLFAVMCGEEISWGQRYLGLETPEALAAVNVQAETNFHNLFGYLFDHLFMLCFVLWLAAVPVLDHLSLFWRQLFARLGLPVASLGLAAGVAAMTLLFLAVIGRSLQMPEGIRPAEIRELLSAAAFLLLMLEVRPAQARQRSLQNG
ncbi:hypothetical protein ACUXV3_20405 (plasmid) [Roseobacteraceae bacterium NS-SX3]